MANLWFSLSVVVLIAVGWAQTEVDAAAFPGLDLEHPAAPFVMTSAYAREMGATAEWRKMEGVIHDAANRKLYMAVSEIAQGMADGEGDIALEENLCGAVYVADLDESFDIGELTPLVVGGPFDDADEDNPCALDAIANPDNLAVDAKGRVWIGEDSGFHANNALWVFDPASGDLRRFATVPAGAEVTGLHISPAGTVFMNVQHPDPDNIYPFNRGLIGVVQGFNANTDDFRSMAVPNGDALKRVHVASGSYQILGRVGETIPGVPDASAFGEISAVASGEHLFFCNDPDGNMFLSVNAAGTEGYLYTNFECRPGGMSKLYVRLGHDNRWDVIEGERVDFAQVNGTMTNCFATVTPWNTGLSGEEYPAETAEDWADSAEVMRDYLGREANPYDYGYPLEVIPAEGVGTRVVKHYAMGRFSVENAVVMPDEQTVYYGDDGSDRVLYKFVADEPGNLDAGTLYAAHVEQRRESFALTWLELGHGVSEDVHSAIRAFDRSFGVEKLAGR